MPEDMGQYGSYDKKVLSRVYGSCEQEIRCAGETSRIVMANKCSTRQTI